MAIYRAVGQNTYEFVMKTQFSLGVDLTDPCHALPAPFIYYAGKYNDTDYTGTYIMAPYGRSSISATTFTVAKGSLGNKVNYLYYGGTIKSCVVDGQTYYGTTCATWHVDTFTTSETFSTSVSYSIGAVKYKVIKYQAATGTIVTEEYNFDGISNSFSTGASSISINTVYVTFPKTADDLILWIETEFPEE